MTIRMLYGRGTLEIDLPSGCQPTIIEKRTMPVIDDPATEIARALDQPSEQSLSALAARAKSACILICDITRPVPNGLFLRPMIERMVKSGIDIQAITVLVATGLHRPNEGRELDELVGDTWVMSNVKVENHFAEDDDAHVSLGMTSRGTPIGLDRRFVNAELRIATGLVEPHFMAGWSGGRKVVAPGIAHAETIRTFHSSRFMAHPQADNCILDGNPLHEEQLEIVGRLGPCHAFNVVIDDHRRPAMFTFGDIVQSHLDAVRYVEEFARVEVDRRYKTVVTSSAGYPLDKTYYQTVKGMVSALDALESGGDLIIVSECSEGLGSSSFRSAQERLVELGTEGFWRTIEPKKLADIDEWQTQMQLKPMRKGRVHLYSSGLKEEDRGCTGVEFTDSIRSTIASSMDKHQDQSVAFIPEGPYVVPQFRGTK